MATNEKSGQGDDDGSSRGRATGRAGGRAGANSAGASSGASGGRARASRSRVKAAGSDSTTARARVRRSSRRKQETAPPPGSPVVDVSKDPVIEAADQKSMTAPVSELQALDQEHLRKLAAAQRSRVIKAVVLGVIAVLFVAFVLQNARPVNVKLVFGTVTVRMIWVIVVTAALGALAGFLVARPDQNIHFHLPERRGKRGKATTAE